MNGSFTIGAASLAGAVRHAARWLDTRTTVPQRACLLLNVADGQLTVSGMSENVSARAVVLLDEDNGASGSCLVSGKLLKDIAPLWPDKPVHVEVGATALQLTVGGWHGTLPTMDASNYPALAEPSEPIGVVDGARLAYAVQTVSPSIDARHELVALTGMHLAFTPEALALSGTNRYQASQLLIEWEPTDGIAPGEAALVPVTTLKEATAELAEGEPVTLGWDGHAFSMTTAARSLVTRTLDRKEYPAQGLASLLAGSGPESATLAAADFAHPLKMAAQMRGDDYDDMSLQLSEDCAVLTARSTKVSEQGSDEVIPAVYDGPEATILLRASYLRTALTSAPGGEAVFSFTPGSPRPIIVTAPADPAWRHLFKPLTRLGGAQ